MDTPLTSRAKKHSVVIQCVTRTSAECRSVVVVAFTTDAELGRQAESLTAAWYHVQQSRSLGGMQNT